MFILTADLFRNLFLLTRGTTILFNNTETFNCNSTHTVMLNITFKLLNGLYDSDSACLSCWLDVYYIYECISNVQTGNNKVKFQVVTCFVQVMVGGRMRYRASPPPSTYKPGYFVPTSLQGLFSWIKTTQMLRHQP